MTNPMNPDARSALRENISALADGQLRGRALADVLDTAAGDPEARATWKTYHLIGEVLRAGDQALPRSAVPDLAPRLRARLQAEAARPLPAADAGVRVLPATTQPLPAVAANDGRWKLVAGIASFAAVGSLAWSLFAPMQGGSAQQLARQSVPPAGGAAVSVASSAAEPGTVVVNAMSVAGSAAPQVMLRDARLDAFLRNQRLATAQPAEAFLRNATFAAPAR